MVKFNKSYFLIILSGILAALSSPPFNLGFLIWFAFIPLLIFIFNYSEEKKWKKLFLFGLIPGLIYSLFLFRWFWSVYPLDALGIHNNFASFFIVLFAWLINSFGYALPWGVFAVAVGILKKSKKISLILIIPSLWILTEYLQSYGMAFYLIGKQTTFGAHWGMNNIAYSLHNNPLALKLASIGGMYFVAFFILLVNVLIFTYLRERTRKNLIILLIPLALILFGPLWISSPINESDDIPIAIAQTKIPTKVGRTAQEELVNFENKINLLEQASELELKPKIVIFPEGANVSTALNNLFTPQHVKNYFNNLFDESTLIIDSSIITDEEGRKSKTIFIDSKVGLLETYNKRLLTPYGEYLPYHMEFIFKFLKGSENKATKELFFVKGNKRSPTRGVVNGPKVNVFTCAEIFSPELVSEVSNEIANTIVIQASTSRFNGNKTVIEQMKAAAKFRAVENNRYLVLATNYGPSYIVNNKGEIIKEAANLEAQLFTGFIKNIKDKSWYNRVKNLILFLAAIVVFFAALDIWVRNKKSSHFS